MSGVECPKCDGAHLLPLEVGEIMLDRCERCAGIWFDHGELEAVVGLTAAAQQDPVSDNDGGPDSGLCPRCRVEMRPVQAVGDPSRPVRVDRCPSCMGLWLDRHRVQPIEDKWIPYAVHVLFIGAQADAEVVSQLPAGQLKVVREACALLRNHPQRTALLAYLERGMEDSEGTPCPSDE
jgi:Zn-finger nucleic acid-binding protein